MSFKTEITDINLNGFNYKYHSNKYDNIHYLTSTEQNQDIIDFINIFISNMTISNMNINWDIIKHELDKYKSIDTIDKIVIEDKFNIFNVNIKYKHQIDNKLLLSNFLTKYQNSRLRPVNIPTDLFLNNNQLAIMLINEINKVNTNLNYSHYIVCNNNDLMDLSFRFVYKENQLGMIMNKFNEKHGYDYFEINIKLSPLHPYLPPIISYSKPKVDIKLILSIYELDIWKPTLWNYLISLDWLINNLASSLEQHFIKYIDVNDSKFNFIEIKMLELDRTSTDYDMKNDIFIDLKFNKITMDETTNNGFKKGTGYGNNDNNKWDIAQFIDLNKTKDEHNIEILYKILDYISINKEDIPIEFKKYIINKFKNINLLLINSKIKLYLVYLKIINIINDIEIIKMFVEYSKDFVDEIKMIIQQTIEIDEPVLLTYTYYLDLFDKNKDIYKIENNKIDIHKDDIKEKYIQMVKENNYKMMNLNSSHRFYHHRTNTINPKTIMRIMSELSSLKKDLPISWDSSIIMRISQKYTNLISFIIVGPKDTPYHNGLFEFHAYFPDGYPTNIPMVLIKTTDNDKVRFNPNLYSSGKVCLSLLGTWSGEKGESWIPEISTFFQVLLSIQSLILVDEPYFNEPGYERSMNTNEGKKQSCLYNDSIRYETLRVAMVGMLKNKIEGYETFIEQHFKFKKDEIIEVVDKWYNESYHKDRFKIVYDELLELINKL
jgi:ubiquitin-protein ligase